MAQTQVQLSRAMTSLAQAIALLSQVAASNAQAATLLARASAKMADAVNDIAFDSPGTQGAEDKQEVPDKAAAADPVAAPAKEPSLKTAPEFQVRMTKALAKLPDGQKAKGPEVAKAMGITVDEFDAQSRLAGKKAKKLGTGIAEIFYSRDWVIDGGKQVREYAITQDGRKAVEAAEAEEQRGEDA